MGKVSPYVVEGDEKYRRKNKRQRMDEVKKLKEHFSKVFSSGQILDIGTGEGNFIVALYEAGATKVVGIEPVEGRAIVGQAKGLDIRTCKFEYFDSDETFDLICFRESIYYMSLEKVFSLLDRVLRPGGSLYIKSHSANSIYYWRIRAPGRWGSTVEFKPTLAWLVTQLKQQGYWIREADYFIFNVLRCLGIPFGNSFIGSIIGHHLSPIARKLGKSDRFYIIASKKEHRRV